MTPRPILAGATPPELAEYLRANGFPAYRAKQIRKWICEKFVADPAAMSDLPEELRKKLAADFLAPSLAVDDRVLAPDVEKLRLKLHDGEFIEMALLPSDERLTFCLSTQVGCPVRCRFCASGAFGLKRNLVSGEMLEEFLTGATLAGRRPDNLVFMGIGEGLMNFAELSRTLTALTEEFCFSPRRITVSTSGFVPGMREFAKLHREYTLAVSLHAPDDATRAKLIPDACRYPIAEILAAADLCRGENGRDYTLEYTLISGVNDALEQAEALGKLAYKHHAKVNLIPYNETTGEFRRPPERRLREFEARVAATGARVTRRVERGGNSDAACGQLRIKALQKKEGSKDGRG